MQKRRENIYRSCRERAGLTRVAAAARLSVSERLLAYYETGQTPPDGMALAMARLYRAPGLKVRHLAESNLVFRDVFKAPKMPESEDAAIIGVCREASDLPAALAGLMDGACGRAAKSAAGHVKELLDVAGAIVGFLGAQKANAACSEQAAAKENI